MSGSQTETLDLSPIQKELRERVRQHLAVLTEKIHLRYERSKVGPARNHEVVGPVDLVLKQPERLANVLGVFGPRGAGKTTILVELLKDAEEQGRSNGWYTLPADLDLSLAPEAFPTGLSILSFLHSELRRRRPRCRTEEADRLFGLAQQAYARRSVDYREVLRSAASGPRDFGRLAAIEVEGSLSLGQRIHEWLDAEARAQGFAGFLLVVDDVDLVRSQSQEPLVWSLLDELHQSRLILILGADLDRLVTQTASHQPRPVTARTAEELWLKALPLQNRFEVQPWEPAERSSLVLGRHERGRQVVPPAELSVHLSRLLPRWPRQLAELRLSALARLEPAADRLAARTFLECVADASGNRTLGNQLAQNWRLPRWARTAQWENLPTSTVPQVLQEAGDPDQPAYWLTPEVLPFPAFGDDETDAAWMEVVVDLGLMGGHLTLSELSVRVPTLRGLKVASTFEMDLPLDAVYPEFSFGDRSETIAAEASWVVWTRMGDEFRVQFGVSPLFELVGGRRYIWSEDVLSANYVGSAELLANESGVHLGSTGEGLRTLNHLPVRICALHLAHLATTRLPRLARGMRVRRIGTLARIVAGLHWIAWARVVLELSEAAPGVPARVDVLLGSLSRGWSDDSWLEWEDQQGQDEFARLIDQADGFLPLDLVVLKTRTIGSWPDLPADVSRAELTRAAVLGWVGYHRSVAFRGLLLGKLDAQSKLSESSAE